MPDTCKGDRRLILAIFLIALALRIAYLIDIRSSPYFEHPLLDSYWYDSKAADVLNGDLLVTSGSFRVPLYVYFLAGCYQVFGHSYTAVVAVQAVLGALCCVVLYLISRRIFGMAAALIAGLGFAVYRMAIYSDGEILPTTVFITLMLGAVYFTVRAVQSAKLGSALSAGVLLGLAFWTRPDILPLAVLLAIAVVIVARPRRGVRLVAAMWMALAAFMLLLGYRNYEAFGKFYVFSPQGAVNLYIGNASFADGKTPVAPPTRYPYDIATEPSEDSIVLGCRQAATENVGRELSDTELSAYYIKKTLAEIGGDFPRWAGLVARKCYYFLNNYERSDIKLIPRFIEHNSSVLRLPLLPYGAVAAPGIVGLVLAVRDRKRLAEVMVAGFAAFALNSILFFVVWRYRLPAVPFLLAGAGYCLTAVYGCVRVRAARRLAAIGVALVALATVSFSHLWGVNREEWETHHIMNEGALLLKAGDYDRAVAAYREALEKDPSNPRAYFYLGKALATEGDIEESKKMMETATRMNPNYIPFADMALGVGLANIGRFDEAAPYFERALEADPDLGLAAYNLGLCLTKIGEREQAERAFTRAENLCKDDRETLVAIARAYVAAGLVEKGLRLARSLIDRNPNDGEAVFAAGLALEAAGRTSEAVSYYERALRLMPASQELRRKIRDLKAQGFGGSKR